MSISPKSTVATTVNPIAKEFAMPVSPSALTVVNATFSSNFPAMPVVDTTDTFGQGQIDLLANHVKALRTDAFMAFELAFNATDHIMRKYAQPSTDDNQELYTVDCAYEDLKDIQEGVAQDLQELRRLSGENGVTDASDIHEAIRMADAAVRHRDQIITAANRILGVGHSVVLTSG